MVSKPKPSRKLSKGKLKKKAHAVLRDIVILRDGGCVCPPPIKGHSKILQAGHVIPGTKGGTYFDLFNVHCQCSSCNSRHVRYEKYYVGFVVETFGEAEYLRLCRDSENDGLKSYEIEEIIVQLSAIHEKQKSNPSFKPYFTQAEILSGAWNAKQTEEC